MTREVQIARGKEEVGDVVKVLSSLLAAGWVAKRGGEHVAVHGLRYEEYGYAGSLSNSQSRHAIPSNPVTTVLPT